MSFLGVDFDPLIMQHFVPRVLQNWKRVSRTFLLKHVPRSWLSWYWLHLPPPTRRGNMKKKKNIFNALGAWRHFILRMLQRDQIVFPTLHMHCAPGSLETKCAGLVACGADKLDAEVDDTTKHRPPSSDTILPPCANCGILRFLCTITYHYALTISNLPHKLSRCCCACFVNFAASLYHLLTGLAISSQDCQGSKNITLFLCCYCFQFMYQVTHRRGGKRQIEKSPMMFILAG